MEEIEMPGPVDVKPSPAGVPGALADPELVEAFDVEFTGAAETPVRGYLSRPAKAGAQALPAIIVIHTAAGLEDHIKDVCNRLAALGYLTLGVDLYVREGGPPPMDDIPTMMERLFAMSDETALGDLTGAAAYLRAREDCEGRIGCIGFCMGGRHTLLFACAREELSAAVDCWGGFIDKATFEEASTPTRPTPPLQIADQLSCPLLAAIGAEDANPSPAVGEQLRMRAGASGKEVKVDVYEDAGHAFFADPRPSYRPAAAARLWGEVVPFFERHLMSGPGRARG
jgi:carboxymethylenebutenolidase